jgi:hypothetical protein
LRSFDDATHLPGGADIGARKPAADNIDRLKAMRSDRENVGKPLGSGKILFKDFRRIRVYLHLPHGLHPGPRKA